MQEKHWSSIEELNAELERRMAAVPDVKHPGMFDNGTTGYEDIRDWYLAEREKLWKSR